MRLTSENKDKIRRRILDGAASLFRQHGYDGVNIDAVMSTAGLTRGAFYAHFKSKSALFRAVILHKHPILTMLQNRRGTSSEELWQEMLQIFSNYLAPQHLQEVYLGCTLVALTGRVARSSDEIKQAYDLAWNAVVDEMQRGQGDIDRAQTEIALVVAVGALNIAAATADKDQQARILTKTHKTFQALIGSK